MEKVLQLEKEFGRFAGYTKDQTVACSSGTAALHLALEALGLPHGTQVIMSDFNMIACPRACSLANLGSIFIDCTPDTLLLDVDKTIKYIESGLNNISAILCTHIYGRTCDMEGIHDIACKYSLAVIEDMAEAHGCIPHPQTDAVCWSFYKNKIIAGEEGGAVAFRDEKHTEKARSLRSLGFGPNQDYQHIQRGHNYRLASCLAEKILESLDNVMVSTACRQMIERFYDEYCPENWEQPRREAPWVYDIRIPGLGSTQQDAIVKALKLVGIEARHAFKPMSSQEEYKYQYYKKYENVEAIRASREVIYLPLASPNGIVESDCKRAFDTIISTLADIESAA